MPLTDAEKNALFTEFLGRLRRAPGSRGVISHRDLRDVGPLDHQPIQTASSNPTPPSGSVLVIVKQSDAAPSNNSTTLITDTELVVPLGTNQIWTVDLYAFVTYDAGFGGFQMDWSLPAGATHNTLLAAATDDVGNGGGINNLDDAVNGTTALGVFDGGNSFNVIEVHSVLRAGATAGNASFQYAQANAVVGDTTLKADTYLIAHRFTP